MFQLCAAGGGRLDTQCQLGLAVFLDPRTNFAAAKPGAARPETWIDALGVDSAHDYDPVWRRCVELGVSPTFHSNGLGWGSRTSVSNYVHNHLGGFAAAGEAGNALLVQKSVASVRVVAQHWLPSRATGRARLYSAQGSSRQNAPSARVAG